MKNFVKIFALALLCASCADGFEVDTMDAGAVDGLPHDMIVLGKQLEDPYSLENMTKACEALFPTKAGRVGLKATDRYVRLLPETQADFDRLEDMGLVMVDHPVDYEILKEGDYYHDPGLDDECITWQYAVVGMDFVCPEGVRCEEIHNCYIAEHDIQSKASGIDWAAVEREAFRLTGNGDLLVPATRGSDAVPAGRISIVDDALEDPEPIGVAGVKVSCNSFVKFAHGYTDEEGYYKLNKSFSSDVRYRVVFENKKGFKMGFNLILVPASYSTLGKHSPAGVNVTIDKNSDRKLFTRAVVNNAGYDYFNACSANAGKLKTPPSNLRLWLFPKMRTSLPVMLQQGCMIDNSVIGEYLGDCSFLLKLFMPDILLGLGGCDDYASVYAEALHQFAHASHYMVVGNSFWDQLVKYDAISFITSGGTHYGSGSGAGHNYCEIGEMWAYYMQTVLYRDRYPESPRTFGTEFWFYPQIMLYLDDRGLDRFKLFLGFSSDVTDRETLQARLISLYPEYKNTINQAFSRYI